MPMPQDWCMATSRLVHDFFKAGVDLLSTLIQSPKPPTRSRRYLWNFLETPYKLWNTLKTSLKHIWNFLEIPFEFLSNTLETHWELPQNSLQSSLKHPWNFLEVPLKHHCIFPDTTVELLSSTLETPLKLLEMSFNHTWTPLELS